MSRATLEQDKKKTRAKDGPGAETDRKEREEYGEETDELEDDVPQPAPRSFSAPSRAEKPSPRSARRPLAEQGRRGLGFPFEADFRPLELPRPIPKHLL